MNWSALNPVGLTVRIAACRYGELTLTSILTAETKKRENVLMPAGRKTTYTPEKGAAIIAEIASGKSVPAAIKGICESSTTFFNWLRQNPALVQDYVRAREHRADARAERVDEICERVSQGKLDPNSARVMIDAIKWQCAHELPARYSDKQRMEHSGPDGGPVQSEHRVVFVQPRRELEGSSGGGEQKTK